VNELLRTEGFPARLREVIPKGKVTSLASEIGRSEGALRKWLRGEAEPNLTDLRLLSAATGVGIEWLVIGGEVRFSVALVLKYLAVVTHHLDCERRHKVIVPWSELSAARKRTLERHVGAALNAWVQTSDARA
jgi:transcriptional regulator with XRE-family HTH domain